ncbi:MAG: hypothetical protein Kow0077_18120 [Anaerolineae bacterium]
MRLHRRAVRLNHRLLHVMALLLILLGLRAGWPAQAQTGATLRIATPPLTAPDAPSPIPDPVTLRLDDRAGRDLIENLFVGLFRYDPAAGAAVPVLAREWTVSPDGLTWTFTLRDDIAWVSYDASSGEVDQLRPVVAADVVAALRRACHPLRPTPESTAIFAIRGCYTALQANPLVLPNDQIEALVGAEAPDSTTLVLHLAFPVSYLPSLLTAPEFRPVPREFTAFSAAWTRMASSGPYVLKEASEEGLSLIRNPFWPESLPGNLNAVTLRYTEDPAASFAAGDTDFARLPATPANAALPDVVATRGWRVTMLGFSSERAWINDSNVRRALAWSIDRAAVLNDDPLRAPVNVLTHPAAIDGGAIEQAGLGYEPEAARAALAEAGYPNCAGVPEIMGLGVPPGLEGLAEQLVAGWSQTLGCHPALFEIVTVRAPQLQNIARNLIDQEYNDRIHLWLATYTPEHVDVHGGAADAFHCGVGYFYSGMDATTCAALDTLIDLATQSALPDRPDVYRQLEAWLFGAVGSYPAVPLWAEREITGIRSGLKAQALGPAWWGDWTLAE